MLTDFFKLNRGFRTISTLEDLLDRLATSNGLRDILFEPSELRLLTCTAPTVFYDKKFTNVSFSKTTITGITFRNCEFIDCLFLGTRFVDCRFHDSTFTGCNPHRVEFEGTYIDPSVFVGMLDKRQHSNIGINLFHQLYVNSMKISQREFAITAEFNRHKWRRYSLDYKERQRKEKLACQFRGRRLSRQYLGQRFNRQYLGQWLSNISSWLFLGYGIRFRFVFFWMLTLAVISLATNFTFWEHLSVMARDGQPAERGLVETLYYTATIPSGLGDFTPASDAGRIVFLIEGFFGFAIVSLFATWLVKRCLR